MGCFYCGHEGCEHGCPEMATYDAVMGTKETMSSCDCPLCANPDAVPACADCPADDYLTVIRVMASEIDALEREADAVRDLLSQLLDHVRWDSIPESLCHAIDAELDGNTEDESE